VSAIAAALKHMLAAGMPHDAIVVAVAAMEVEMAAAPRPPPQPRAIPVPDESVWVYVIAVDHPGDVLVKVGISKHPRFRMSTLEKERGYNLYLAHTEGPFSRSDATAVERQAHHVLADERERGEWFLCGAERATEVVRLCANGNAQ
jgi:hypothetical protein